MLNTKCDFHSLGIDPVSQKIGRTSIKSFLVCECSRDHPFKSNTQWHKTSRTKNTSSVTSFEKANFTRTIRDQRHSVWCWANYIPQLHKKSCKPNVKIQFGWATSSRRPAQPRSKYAVAMLNKSLRSSERHLDQTWPCSQQHNTHVEDTT